MIDRKRAVMPFLLRALNPSVKTSVERRFDAMVRELEYLRSRQNDHLMYLQSKGWDEERLMVLFVLNSTYQLCIGPIQASARVNAGLGGELPIRHGAEVFGHARMAEVTRMVNDFFAMVSDLGFVRDWMTKNTCGDLVYWIARHQRELDEILGQT